MLTPEQVQAMIADIIPIEYIEVPAGRQRAHPARSASQTRFESAC